MPTGLLVLLRYVLDGRPQVFQSIGAPLCGLFPFIVMFLVTSIAMLRERTSRTLERLMTLPLAKADLLVGYGLAFGALAAVQAAIVCLAGFAGLGLDAPHGAWLVGLLAIGNAVLGMALGLFAERVRPYRVPGGPVHAGDRPTRCCCAGCSYRARRWRACCTRSRGRFRSTTPTTRWTAPRAQVRSAPGSRSTSR